MNVNDNLINEMVKYFNKYPTIEKVVLFGSRARGDSNEKSDYDIAVYGELTGQEKVNLSSVFNEDLPTLHKIDLIFMSDQKKSEFTESIEKEGKIIYEKN